MGWEDLGVKLGIKIRMFRERNEWENLILVVIDIMFFFVLVML